VWVALAEKAYAQFSQSGTTNLPNVPAGSKPIPNSYQNINGSWGYRGLPSITGTNGQYFSDIYAEYDNTNDSRSGIFPSISQISTWLASGRAVSAATIKNPTLWIVGRHEYVILGVDTATNTLTLYNPHGTTPPPGQRGHGEINGVRTISYTDFAANFNMVSVA
jgi:hypothetical protein